MGWQSAQEALHTRNCSVPNCTGLVYKEGDLCGWHVKNGTPDQYRSKRVVPTDERIRPIRNGSTSWTARWDV